MEVCIHRGTHEIGGSCVELKAQGKRIILDLGLPIDAEANDKQYLPHIPGLDSAGSDILAVIISHPHLDHYGLLKHIHEDIPIIMGEAARRIIEAAAPFMPGNMRQTMKGSALQHGKVLSVGPFSVTPYTVDHSGYDAYALLLEADGKRIFYSGDFRTHGRKGKVSEHLINNPPKDIDVLLMEGSSLGRIQTDEPFPSEQEMETQLCEQFRKTKGLSLVHTSAQNIDRVVSIFRACKKTEKTLVIDVYTAAILEATGNEHIPQSDWPDIALYVPQSQRLQIKKNKWFDLLKKHSANRIFAKDVQKDVSRYVILFRPLYIHDLEKAGVLENAIYVYSQWEGYLERESFASVRAFLERNKIKKSNIHTSGHASLPDLKRFAAAINAKKLIPVHTFQPEQYDALFSNVETKKDGESWIV
jgi:ribonuclease J